MVIKITNLGKRLKELRKEKKMSQRQLGMMFNISQESISSYEQNKSNPSFEILCKYADQFDVSLDYIFERTDSKINVRKSDLNTFEEFFVVSYRSISDQGKNMMAKIVRAICEADKENNSLFL